MPTNTTQKPLPEAGLSILLVEDDPLHAAICRTMLKGHQLEWVPTLAQAAAALRRAPNRECVLIDLRLPDGDGQELLSHLQAANQCPAVLIVSARQDEKLAQDLLSQGAQDYLVKGHFNQQRLLESIGYAMARRGYCATRKLPKTPSCSSRGPAAK